MTRSLATPSRTLALPCSPPELIRLPPDADERE